MMKKTIFAFCLLWGSLSLMARDFDVVAPSGHTLYCDVVDGGASIVGWDSACNSLQNVHLVIPSHAFYGSINMHVVAIGDNAFKQCTNLESVVIPSSVRSIGCSAFEQCCFLGSISIPQSVESIGENAFRAIPNVEYAGTAQGAPWGASCLNAYHERPFYFSDSQKKHLVCCERDATDANFPSSVSSIGQYAFAYCYNLQSICIDSSITYIGGDAFSYSSLERASYNPSLSSMFSGGSFLFSECHNLKQLTIGNAVTNIPYAFCLHCTALTDIVIPDNVTNVMSNAFMGCTSLEYATLGKGLYSTGISMFQDCTSLKEVFLSDSLQLLAGYTFCNCSSLREIVVPIGFRDMGSPSVFLGCGSIARIVCMTEEPPLAAPGVLDSINENIELVVPCYKTSLYQQAYPWNRFENIVEHKYYMTVSSNNRLWGNAVVSQQPTCEDHIAIIEAIPEPGYRFVRWDDNKTDNPRSYNYNRRANIHRTAIFEPLENGVEQSVPDPVRVYTSGGNIVIEGIENEEVVVYDVMGRQILSTRIQGSPSSIHRSRIPAPGIYLVKVGLRKAEKVVVL